MENRFLVCIVIAFLFEFFALIIYWKNCPPQINTPSIDFESETENRTEFHAEVDHDYLQLNKICSNWSSETIKNVTKFVFFFGFNRCGSTITGNIIDAHPNALIANEYLLWNKMHNIQFSVIAAAEKGLFSDSFFCYPKLLHFQYRFLSSNFCSDLIFIFYSCN